MTRYKMTLRFLGTPFHGWQSQENAPAIQNIIQDALGQITQEKIHVTGCSRTDAGVHALAYVAHFDSNTYLPRKNLIEGMNSLLPKEIAVLDLQETHALFHARKDAKFKIYKYQILNSKIRDPLELNQAWHVQEPLECAAMARACQVLSGNHDFSCFQAADPHPRNPIRNMERCEMEWQDLLNEGKKIVFTFQSKGFLKYQIRNMVGTIVEVGQGKRTTPSLRELFDAKDRNLAGPTAPAYGLFLKEVEY